MNFISSDTFQSIAHYSITSRVDPIDISQFNSDKIIFCNTHRLNELFKILKDNENRFLLITHLSDYNIEDTYLERKPKCIIRWFGQNVVSSHFVFPIPIGVFTKARYGESLNPILTQLYNNPKEIKYNVFFHCCITTNLAERERAYEESLKIPNSLVFKNERDDHKTFYENMNQCKFIISPPGYGLDCFRTWEALYMSRIPVVRKSFNTECLSLYFPMILIDIWEDLTLDFLEEKYSRIPKEILNNYRHYLNAKTWTDYIIKEFNENVKRSE